MGEEEEDTTMGSSSEQYCLRWNDFQCNIADAFAELREDEELLDVTLVSEGQALRAHRLVLSACSPLFREMLHHRIPPASHSQPLVFLHGVRFRDAAAILDFMYRGEVNVNQEDLQTFLAAAEELRVRGLSDRGGGGQEQQQQQQHRQSANTRASSTSPPPSSSQRPGGPVKRPAAAAAHSNPDAKRRMDYPDERFQDEAFAGDSFDDSSSPYGQQHLGGGGGGFRGGSAFFKEEEDANGSMTGETFSWSISVCMSLRISSCLHRRAPFVSFQPAPFPLLLQLAPDPPPFPEQWRRLFLGLLLLLPAPLF